MVIITPMRSAKNFFTSGGRRMFAIPTPAKITAVPASRPTESAASPRPMSPAVIAPRAMTVRRSMPSLRSSIGVRMPNTAKQAGGSVPITPSTAGETSKSSPIRSTTGESEATAERSENAQSRMPMTASALPRQSGRADVTTTATARPRRDTRA